MSNNVEKVYLLEEILEIIEIKTISDNNASNHTFEIDYAKLEEIRQKIGEIGEKHIYESEKKRLKNAGSIYESFVDATPAKDPRNGYDILSYTNEGTPIHIEVKSTMGELNTPFYLTANEKRTAEQIRNNGGIYQIHRVYNIGKDIKVAIYDDESSFLYEETLYKVSISKQSMNQL